MHQCLEKYVAECLKGQTPTWMTKGRTVLIQNDKSKGRDASNYLPITCLPLGVEGKAESRGTGDQLYIDKMILREVKVRKKSQQWDRLIMKELLT